MSQLMSSLLEKSIWVMEKKYNYSIDAEIPECISDTLEPTDSIMAAIMSDIREIKSH